MLAELNALAASLAATNAPVPLPIAQPARQFADRSLAA
jgi:hypothetical protein